MDNVFIDATAPTLLLLQQSKSLASNTGHSIRRGCQEWIEGNNFVIALYRCY